MLGFSRLDGPRIDDQRVLDPDRKAKKEANWNRRRTTQKTADRLDRQNVTATPIVGAVPAPYFARMKKPVRADKFVVNSKLELDG
jgi:hypothetical protein